MPGKNGDAVEKPLGGGIRLRQLKSHCVRIQPLHHDGLPSDNQEIALGRIDLFVEIDLKTKDHVISVERLAVREAQSTAKLERILSAVVRHAPGLGQGGLRFLRSAIDVNQVGREALNDLP